MGPRGAGRRRPCRIPAASAGVSAGEVGERRRSSPRLNLGPRKGRGGLRRRRSVAPGGSGRWSASSGEVEAGATVWAARLASVGARGGEGWSNLACGRPAPGACRGCP
jgi:hypothetical protein